MLARLTGSLKIDAFTLRKRCFIFIAGGFDVGFNGYFTIETDVLNLRTVETLVCDLTIEVEHRGVTVEKLISFRF